jgi:glycosyltransferase involved in cell wall biosynthesis
MEPAAVSAPSKASAAGGALDVLIVQQDVRAGGAERVNILLANELAGRGLAVGMALFRRRGEFLGLIDPRVTVSQVGGRRWLGAILPLARLIRRTRPAAVLGVMTTGNTAAVIGALLAGRRARIVLGEHNQVDRNALHFSSSRSYKIMRWIYPMADRIVCVSDGVRRSLLDYARLDPERATVIHNPIVSPQIERMMAEPCADPWLGDPAAPLVLAVGRLTPAKDLPTLLRGFAALRRGRRARLLILGDGEERPAIEALARDLGLGDDVRLAGFVANPYAWMARADLFVLSSAWEGFPTVLVEALACGARVVATDCRSGPREILLGGELGELTPVGDAEALAEAMARALDAPPAPERQRQRAAAFSVSRAADAYVRVLLGAAP